MQDLKQAMFIVSVSMVVRVSWSLAIARHSERHGETVGGEQKPQ